MNYYILDQRNHLQEIMRGTSREVAKFLGITTAQVSMFANANKNIEKKNHNYVIVEENFQPEKDSEEWSLVIQTPDTLTYVSSYGRIKTVNKETRDTYYHKIIRRVNHPEAIVKVNGKAYYLKTLVAMKHKSRDYFKGCKVVCIDGNELNCNIANLAIMH